MITIKLIWLSDYEGSKTQYLEFATADELVTLLKRTDLRGEDFADMVSRFPPGRFIVNSVTNNDEFDFEVAVYDNFAE